MKILILFAFSGVICSFTCLRSGNEVSPTAPSVSEEPEILAIEDPADLTTGRRL